MGNCTDCKAKDVSIVTELFEGKVPAFLCAACSKARAELGSEIVKVFGAPSKTASNLEAEGEEGHIPQASDPTE